MYFVCKWWDTDRLGVLHSSSRPPWHCIIRRVLTWMRQMCVTMQIKVNTSVDVSRFWLKMFYSSLSKVQTNIFEDVYFKISEDVRMQNNEWTGLFCPLGTYQENSVWLHFLFIPHFYLIERSLSHSPVGNAFTWSMLLSFCATLFEGK